MKTIFYKLDKSLEKGDYWFDDTPGMEWFTLDNMLYDPKSASVKETITSGNTYKKIIISHTEDLFSDEGIIRRIGLNIL